MMNEIFPVAEDGDQHYFYLEDGLIIVNLWCPKLDDYQPLEIEGDTMLNRELLLSIREQVKECTGADW